MRFESAAVRAYIEAIRNQVSPLHVTQPPGEFTQVVEAGKGAVPYLIGRLEAKDSISREAAYDALVRITNKRFFLVSEIRNSDVDTIKRGIKQFRDWWASHRDRTRLQWLSEDVYSSDHATAKAAILTLGEEGDITAIPALRGALSKNDLSFYSAGSLANLGDRAAIPFLIDLYLTQDNEGFRRQGLCLLYRLTKRTFDFDPSASQAARDHSIQEWKDWWRSSGKG